MYLAPVNPFDGRVVQPVQPNGGNDYHFNQNRNFTRGFDNRNDYSNNNFNYPYDNTRSNATHGRNDDINRQTSTTPSIFGHHKHATTPANNYPNNNYNNQYNNSKDSQYRPFPSKFY